MNAARVMRVLIVDDEPLARRGLIARLARYPDIEVVGECSSGRELVDIVHTLAPDLVFLDVQMPGIDGFNAIESIGVAVMPMVIFVTAHESHAIRAFDVRALDYLLKPIDDERLAEAIDRARERLEDRRGTPRAERLMVRDRGRVHFVRHDEINYIEADGDYVRLHIRGKSLLIRETLTAIEGRLPPDHFVRIHRSAIVNVRRVKELLPHANREYVVVLQDGTRLKMSRGYRDHIQRLTGDPVT